MSELPRLCAPNTHPSAERPRAGSLERCPGVGGGGLGSALHTPAREAVEGAGAEEVRGGRGGGKRLRVAGGGERQTPRRGTREAGGGSEQRPGGGLRRPGRPGGDPESSMKSPRGRGRGAGLGRLSGGPRHSWQGGGRGGVLGVSRGLGGRVGRAGRGRPEWGRSDSGPGQGGPGCSVSVSVCGASSEPGGVASPLPLLSSVAFLETCKCFRRGGEGGARE